MPKKSDKSKVLTGYKVHKERILLSGGTIIRSIKYPIKPFSESPEASDSLAKLKDSIISDDLKIRGDVNLNDYLECTSNGNQLYTVFDFWIDSLKAGVIWQPDSKSLLDLVNSPFEQIWQNVDQRIKDFFDKEKIKPLILQNEIRKTETINKDSFRKKIASYLKAEYYHEEKYPSKGYKILSPQAEEIVDFITNSFFDEDGKLKLEGQANQEKFWLENFGIDKNIIKSSKPRGKLKDITFTIVPELICINQDCLLDELVNKRQDWLESHNQEEKKLLGYLGLTNNFNGFSNYFGKVIKSLKEDKVQDIFDAISFIQPSLHEKRDVVLSALAFLSDKARKLGDPFHTDSWSNYRGFFGGKLQSWFSNHERRKKEMHKQIENFKNSIEKAKNYLNTKSFPKEAQEEIELINTLLDRLEEFLSKGIENEDNYQIFDSLLSSLKRRLNFFYQAYIQNEEEKEEDEETSVNKSGDFSGLYEKIYKPVTFFGKAIRKRNEKIVYKTIPILESGIETLTSLISSLSKNFSPKETFEKVRKKQETEETVYRKCLNFFWRKYTDKSVNSSFFRDQYIKIISSEAKSPTLQDIEKKKNHKKYTFYRSAYAKGSVSQIEINSENHLESFEKLILEMTRYLLEFDKARLLKDPKMLLDWIELAKTTISHLIRFNTQDEFPVANLNLENFDKANLYIKLFSLETAKKSEFSFIVQSLVLSEIKGAATLYSKKEYLARYSTQVIASNEKFKLFYKPSDPQIQLSQNLANSQPTSPERKMLMRPHLYLVDITKAETKTKKGSNPNALHLGKENCKPVFISEEDMKETFRLSSSPYQLQFLDKYLYSPKGWENVNVTLSEWNFIVEKRYEINWDLENKRPILTPAKTKNKSGKKWVERVYLSIPFVLSASEKNNQTPKLEEITKDDLSHTNYPLLGIDVGEYGLAYALTSIQDNKIDIIETGFIADKNIANIKDEFAKIQQRAKEGAFDEEDNTVSLVRENAIGALRNKVHAIAIKCGGCSIIYEGSISNFETGSGRTTKIYDSVKRADTEFESEADKSIHNHVWGKSTKYIGRALSAHASSYTCIKCARSLYQITEENLENTKIVSRTGNIVTISTPLGEIYGYTQNKEHQQGYIFKKTEKRLSEFRKMIKEFARPPVAQNSEALPEHIRENKEKIENFKKQRGNSSLFVCPFVGCGFVADADMQAALIMAIRGYLRFKGIIKPKKDKEDKSKENKKGIIKPKKDKKDKSKENKKEHSESDPTSYLEETIKYLSQLSNKDALIEKMKFKF
ncbi:MAG: type V CRISPR-associated protein Cas12d [Patescibacteria group bacterium]|nr:type V CRISPR-associated protein Cas12d [Patescibacteria group bacterium]